jgi:dihydroflavonol-4-reductase
MPNDQELPMVDTVLVSGGSGYIAGFLIRQLVTEGWTVHTTVRSLTKEGGVRKLLAVDDSRLRFFAADLNADAGWAEAMAGCSHVAHVASPLPTGVPKDADELIVPARDGALRALRAAKAAGVGRFVMTSSVAAVSYGRGRGIHHFTEADWTLLDKPGLTPYIQSKTIAERAARDWVAKEGGSIEFCTINPSVVLGPVWSPDYSASVPVVKRLLDGGIGGCPDIGFGVVDVRDVADLHVRALKAPGMAGERFIASGRFMKLREIADVLRSGLGPQAHKVTTRNLPDWAVRVAALFNPLARAVVGELGSVRNQDASHAKAVLGWATRPVEQSIVDTARCLIELGIVKP